MMYAAGLTVQEIADRCGRPRSTVQRHLQVREEYEPGLRATHQAAYEKRVPAWASLQWHQSLADVKTFLTTHGRLPIRDDTGPGRTLHMWLKQQRTARTKGTLAPEKEEALSSLGDWATPDHQKTREDHWRAQLARLASYIDEHGEIPRWHRHETETERALGVWLHIQHQNRLEGTLPQWRLQAIEHAIPGWRSRM